MGTLGYTVAMSLDGYIADRHGDFQWAAPSPEIFALHLERMRQTSTEILGRRTYELMAYWEAEPAGETWTPAEYAFAQLWQQLDKVVVSQTLQPEELHSPRDRLVPRLSLKQITDIVDDAPGDVEIFGPTTAAPALEAGLIDRIECFISPRILGGGLRAFPVENAVHLCLSTQRVFANGTVYLRYTRT